MSSSQERQNMFSGCDNCLTNGHDHTMKCGQCRAVRYCSKKCQVEHWKTHKTKCKIFKKSLANKKATFTNKKAYKKDRNEKAEFVQGMIQSIPKKMLVSELSGVKKGEVLTLTAVMLNGGAMAIEFSSMKRRETMKPNTNISVFINDGQKTEHIISLYLKL